jgi:ABC-type phosphate transport system substrate-binding protein
MKLHSLVAAVLLVAICSCSKPEEKALVDSPTTGSFELFADEGIKPVIDSLVTAFNAQYTDAKVTVRYMNATAALDGMLQNKARLALIGRPLTPKERASLTSQKVELPEYEIALNPLAAIVKKENALTSLSLAMLREDISGSKEHYRKAMTDNLSSVESILDSLFLVDTGSVKGKAARFSTTDSVIAKVMTDDGMVGLVSWCWLKNNPGLKALDIAIPDTTNKLGEKNIMLHLAYVYQKLYPLVSRVCAYTQEPPNSLPRGFLVYAMTAPGQKIFFENNMLPRTQIIKIVPPVE